MLGPQLDASKKLAETEAARARSEFDLANLAQDYLKTEQGKADAIRKQLDYYKSPTFDQSASKVKAVVAYYQDQLDMLSVANSEIEKANALLADQGNRERDINAYLSWRSKTWGDIVASQGEATSTYDKLNDEYYKSVRLAEAQKNVWSAIPGAIAEAEDKTERLNNTLSQIGSAVSGIMNGNFSGLGSALEEIFGITGAGSIGGIIDVFVGIVKKLREPVEEMASSIGSMFEDAIAKDDWEGFQEALQNKIKESIIAAIVDSRVLKPYIYRFSAALNDWITFGMKEQGWAWERLQKAKEDLLTAGQSAQDVYNQIPKFASGGVVARPTIAMVGEHGPEAIVPLSRGVGTTINVYGSLIAERDLDSRIYQAMARRGYR